jgi:undecaprenyl-diphosphatase
LAQRCQGWKRGILPALYLIVWAVVLLAVALAGEVSVFIFTTLLIHRHRPRVPHLDAAPPTSSFPSGHTAASVVLYLLIALLLSYRLRSGVARMVLWIVAVLIPILVGLSRLYRGMHYPTDVLSGALLGAVWLFIAVKGVRLGALQEDLRSQSRVQEGKS